METPMIEMMGAWPPICTSVLPLFHDPTLKRWRLTSQHMFFSLVVQVVCDSFPGSWPLYQNHTCPSASSELVIEFLGHDVYQDLDCSLVLLLISRTQPRNIPHTIQNSSLWNCSFWSWTYRKKNVRYDRGSRYTCAKRKRIPTIKSTGPTQNSYEIKFKGLTPLGSCGESHAMEVTRGGSGPLDFISQIRSG